MSPTNPLCAIYPLCNYMNLLTCILYCTISHVSTLWLKLNITVIIFTLNVSITAEEMYKDLPIFITLCNSLNLYILFVYHL